MTFIYWRLVWSWFFPRGSIFNKSYHFNSFHSFYFLHFCRTWAKTGHICAKWEVSRKYPAFCTFWTNFLQNTAIFSNKYLIPNLLKTPVGKNSMLRGKTQAFTAAAVFQLSNVRSHCCNKNQTTQTKHYNPHKAIYFYEPSFV